MKDDVWIVHLSKEAREEDLRIQKLTSKLEKVQKKVDSVSTQF